MTPGIPRLITDAIAAVRAPASQHDAVVHHLLALAETADLGLYPTLSVNTRLAMCAFDVAGARVRRLSAPWVRQKSILRDESAAVTRNTWRGYYEPPDGGGGLTFDYEFAQSVLAGDAPARSWVWVQSLARESGPIRPTDLPLGERQFIAADDDEDDVYDWSGSEVLGFKAELSEDWCMN